MSRLFLAVPVRLDAYESLKTRLDSCVEGRWVDAAQLHVTLSFLGNRFAEDELVERLQEVHFEFDLSEIDALGFFKRNKILYAATRNPSLERLAAEITAALSLPKSRFIPHITLMRVKKVFDYEALHHHIRTVQGKPLGWLMPSTVLFESTLHRDGAKYRELKAWHS